jgi:polar amino acid transport system substrate-binding protein
MSMKIMHPPRRRKSSAIIAVALATALALSGCSNSGDEPDGAGTSGTNASADLGLVQDGVLTVAILPTQRPTSYVEDGEPMGMAIDFTDELAERMGLDVEYTAVELQSALTQISAKRYDTAAMGLVATEERRQMLDFSTPWLYGWFSLMTDSGSDAPKSLDELAGRTVGVVTGSQQENLLKLDYPEIQVRAFPDDTAMLAALVAGQTDGAMVGSNNVKQVQQQYPQLDASDELPLPDPESYPVPKGNSALKDAISEGIEALMNDGTFNEIYAEWHPDEPFPERLYDDYPDMPEYDG